MSTTHSGCEIIPFTVFGGDLNQKKLIEFVKNHQFKSIVGFFIVPGKEELIIVTSSI